MPFGPVHCGGAFLCGASLGLRALHDRKEFRTRPAAHPSQFHRLGQRAIGSPPPKGRDGNLEKVGALAGGQKWINHCAAFRTRGLRLASHYGDWNNLINKDNLVASQLSGSVEPLSRFSEREHCSVAGSEYRWPVA